MKINEIIKHYQENKRDITDTKRSDIACKHLIEHLGTYKASDINYKTCAIYTKKRGVSESTIAREFNVLKAACNLAVKWKLISHDDMPILDMPKNLPRRQHWLTKDEVKKLIKNAKGEMKLFVKLLYFTASRRKAIEELEWNQINFSTKTIYLNKVGQKVTKKRRPTVPMGCLFEDLRKAFNERTGKYVLGNKNRYRDFNKLLKECDLNTVEIKDGRPAGKVTAHILRHSRATHLLEKGKSVYTVAKLLGDSVITVEKTYGHISDNALADIMSDS